MHLRRSARTHTFVCAQHVSTRWSLGPRAPIAFISVNNDKSLSAGAKSYLVCRNQRAICEEHDLQFEMCCVHCWRSSLFYFTVDTVAGNSRIEILDCAPCRYRWFYSGYAGASPCIEWTMYVSGGWRARTQIINVARRISQPGASKQTSIAGVAGVNVLSLSCAPQTDGVASDWLGGWCRGRPQCVSLLSRRSGGTFSRSSGDWPGCQWFGRRQPRHKTILSMTTRSQKLQVVNFLAF